MEKTGNWDANPSGFTEFFEWVDTTNFLVIFVGEKWGVTQATKIGEMKLRFYLLLLAKQINVYSDLAK